MPADHVLCHELLGRQAAIHHTQPEAMPHAPEYYELLRASRGIPDAESAYVHRLALPVFTGFTV